MRPLVPGREVGGTGSTPSPWNPWSYGRTCWHPHLHMLLTCGAFTFGGDFLELPELDLERLEVAWREAVFGLYLAEEKIEPEVVENMRTWEHSGFGVDQSVLLAAGDQAGIERLVQYMTRCPFSLSRLVKVSDKGQVIYKAERASCRSFPDPGGDGLQAGAKRNYQILSPLDFLAPLPPQTGHAAYSGQGISPDPLLRLVLQQEPRDAEEGRGSNGRVIRHHRRGGRVAQSELGDADQADSTKSTHCHVRNVGIKRIAFRE